MIKKDNLSTRGGRNQQLHRAKRRKDDEFYTQYSDIESELFNYTEQFRGKTVLCNCDDPRVSNFFKFFANNFEYLGLKRVVTTCYKNIQPDLFSSGQGEKAVYLIYDGNGGKPIPDFSKVDVRPLEGDGDFRSPECVELLKQADVVVTNPPFSLFREYIALLEEYGKKFLVIGNQNAITYKDIFPLIKDGRLWLGCTYGDMKFMVPDWSEPTKTRYWQDESGQKWKSKGNTCWFTNIDHKRRHEDLVLYKRYNPEAYPKFDNYDAINVDHVSDIPYDYDGVMGVPISFLYKFNPDQFEIVEFRKGSDGKDLVYSTRGGAGHSHSSEYSSVDVDRRVDEQSEGYRSTEQKQVCEDSYPTTSIPGMIKNAEGSIGGARSELMRGSSSVDCNPWSAEQRKRSPVKRGL